jgi:hypothetical protein
MACGCVEYLSADQIPIARDEVGDHCAFEVIDLYPSRSRRAVDRDRRTNSSARALARRSINGRQDGADRALHGLAEPRNQLRRRRWLR